MEVNVKVSFTLSLRQDCIAHVHFLAYTLGNAHGRKNLLSFLAMWIRDLIIICADAGRRNGDFYGKTEK